MQEKNIDTSSNQLKAYRLRENLSQQELADILGVARNYIYLIESGRKPITDSIKSKLRMLESGEIDSEIKSPVEVIKNFEKRLSAIETLLIQVLSELRKKSQ